MDIKTLRNNALVNNTFLATVGFAFRAIIQAGYFIIIVRKLGPVEYGAFVAVVAFIGAFVPFSMCGSGNLLIKHVAQDRSSFSKYWGASLSTIIIGTLVFLIVILAIFKLFLPSTTSVMLVLIIGISDLLFARIIDLSGQAFQAIDNVRRMVETQIALNISRLIAAVIFLFIVPGASANNWAFLYLCSTVLAAMWGLFLVTREIGTGRLNPTPIIKEFKQGFYFSISQSSQIIYNDIDKTMLSKYSSLEATGIYGAAYRLLDIALTPIRGLMYSSYSRFFKEGRNGIKGTTPFLKKIIPWTALYGGISIVGIFVFSSIVPLLIGEEYIQTTIALKLLSPIIFFRSLHYFLADALTGAGYQGIRSLSQIGIAVFNILINLILIPKFNWYGAVYSSIISDCLLFIVYFVVILVLHKKEQA